MQRISLILLLIVYITSCNPNTDSAVASYGDYKLYKIDIQKVLPPGLDIEDSTAFVHDYIENWTKDKVFLNNSNEILNDEELEKIENKVNHYREEITSSFIEQRITADTKFKITDKKVKEYYIRYKESFDLKEDYIYYNYMNVPSDSVTRYKELLKSEQYSVLEKMLEMTEYDHDFEKDHWVKYSDFKQSSFFPSRLRNTNLQTRNQIYTIDQGEYTFIFELVDLKRAGDPAPLPIVKDVIKNVLINKRKLNLLSERKKELYNEALQNDEIKRN